MTDESDEDPWLKRIQWSRTGFRFEDERINALTSLWVEGVLSAIEVPREVQLALRQRIGLAQRPDGGTPPEMAEFAQAAKAAAHWFALVNTTHFCAREEWDTPAQKLPALAMMEKTLGMPRATKSLRGRSPAKSWINDICHQPAGRSEEERRMDEALARWRAGTSDRRTLRQALLEIYEQVGQRKNDETLYSPELSDRFQIWVQDTKLAIKGMVLRTVADYCEARGWTAPQQREQALKMMDQALAQTPTRESDRGR